MSEQPWYSYYPKGQVIRHSETPSVIAHCCDHWYDGANSAMYQFYSYRPVSIRKLLKEISSTLEENTQGEVWNQRLRDVLVWAQNQKDLCDAAENLAKAVTAFNLALISVQFDAHDAHDLRAHCLKGSQ